MQRVCKNCQTGFEITEEDVKFYDKISPVFSGKKYLVSPPTLCPPCREQRRLAFRNERNLYYRKCNFTGKQIISSYSADKPLKVFYREIWWSDKWDPLVYGVPYDFTKPFFAQFAKLMQVVPRMSLFKVNCEENCEFVNLEYEDRNCYMIFTGGWAEDCYYGHYFNHSRNCIDGKNVNDSEKCYELAECRSCYNCRNSLELENCSDCAFCFDCQSCRNCFGSYNLRNKQYYFFNEKLEREEYLKKLSALDLGSQQVILALQKRFQEEVLRKAIRKYAFNVNTHDCTGDYLKDCKDCEVCFELVKSRDLKYSTQGDSLNDSMDCYISGYPGELCYESMSQCVNVFHNLFSNFCWEDCSELIYCDNCFSCSNCFGCIGLRHKKYCILNKQYTKEEYESLVSKIIEYMQKDGGWPAMNRSETTGSWGEFFPAALSPYAYNETVAQEFFPLRKEEALQRNLKWKDDEETYAYVGPKVSLPDNIRDVSAEICNQILTCEQCGKLYKIIKQELKFYQEMNIPVPRNCFNCRHLNRMALRNPRKLWDRTCMKCGEAIKTTYSPERPETVYCEKCYLKTVY